MTMSNSLRQRFQALLILGLIFAMPAGFAETKYKRVYDARAKQYYYVPEKSLSAKTKSTLRNPIVKDAAIGTAVGAAAGALSDRSSALKGAGIGALVGAGSGLIDQSATLDGKPLVKSSLKGAAIGTGTSAIMGGSKVKGAAAGAAAGAGVQLFKDYLNKPSR